jgi:hypothetical protein
VEIVTLEGLAGDDRANLSGSGNIIISDQVIALGATIFNSHVEATYLTASGSNDLLTYNGVSGVSENITLSSAGVEGGGQLSVPGETLVIFTGVEHIVVNGTIQRRTRWLLPAPTLPIRSTSTWQRPAPLLTRSCSY